MKSLLTRLLLLALLLCGVAQAEVVVPELHHRVTDLTATLEASQQRQLESKLAAFEQRKGAQVAVLMLPTTQPETIEQFGIKVAEAWKVGRKGVDDGAILIIAKNDHKLRIEVGYGLEGALNDATSKRIIAEVIAPYFKQQQFYQGIDAGIDRILQVIDGEPLPEPVSSSFSSPNRGDTGFAGAPLMFLAFFIFIFGNIILRQWLGVLPSGTILAGVIGLLVGLVLASVLWAMISAFITFMLSLLFGSGAHRQIPYSGGSSSWNTGGSSWSSSDSSSSSDFSGGGGDFGGGGASGDW